MKSKETPYRYFRQNMSKSNLTKLQIVIGAKNGHKVAKSLNSDTLFRYDF